MSKVIQHLRGAGLLPKGADLIDGHSAFRSVRRHGGADYRFEMPTQFVAVEEPGRIAGLLVRDGILTLFQAEYLMQGKWRRFNIGEYKVLERLGAGRGAT